MQRAQPGPLSRLLETLRERERESDLTVGDLVSDLGRSTYGMVLAVPALISILPVVGALPGVSLGMGAIALVLSAQMLVGAPAPWLPPFLARIALPADKVDRAIERAGPWVRRLERLFRPRWSFLTERPLLWLDAVLATGLSVLMLIGALVPGGIVPPALALLVLSIGLATRDGLLIALSLAGMIGLVAAGAWFFL